jgi:antirestriction protein ArdC
LLFGEKGRLISLLAWLELLENDSKAIFAAASAASKAADYLRSFSS